MILQRTMHQPTRVPENSSGVGSDSRLCTQNPPKTRKPVFFHRIYLVALQNFLYPLQQNLLAHESEHVSDHGPSKSAFSNRGVTLAGVAVLAV